MHVDLDAAERRQKRPRKRAKDAAALNEEYARIMSARGETLKPLSKSGGKAKPKPVRQMVLPKSKAAKKRAKKKQQQNARIPKRQPVVTIRHLDDPGGRPKKVYTTPQGKAYESYINSQEWADKRTLYWRTAGYGCKAVGCSRKTNLHVHHHTYERLGNERLSDLLGLCIPHHDEVHAFHEKNRSMTLTEATSKVTGVQL